MAPRRTILALVTLAVGFMALAIAVSLGATRAIDSAILLALRVPGHPAIPRGPGWLTGDAVALTRLGSPAFLWALVLASAALLACTRRVRMALFLVATTAGGLTLVSLAKLAFHRARPDVVSHLVPVQTLSFPSGHAADSAIVYCTLALLALPCLRAAAARAAAMTAALGLPVAIGLTRIYLGVHWPSDVVAGWCIGAFWALLAHAVGRAGAAVDPSHSL
ncbi:MAG: phosphatase PAP2 family protein [Sphingomonadales bacterium]|nr:phosphatase PAP2 family protein [Sphingomonadales bacterium]